jgi:Zn-dependent protease
MMSCRRCGAALEPDALACASCQALVHEDRLTQLREEALAHEKAGHFATARATWIEALRLLPRDSRQASWVAHRTVELKDVPDTESTPASAAPQHKWPVWLGPLIPLALLLFKGKGLLALFNAKTLVSLGAFMGLYGQQFGWAFGAGFALLILVHELGHYVDIRRRGLPADMPVFLPGLGAYVRWRALGVPDAVRAEVSLAGPLAGLLASIVCATVWWLSDAPLWAALARASAWLNILNLIPIWVLDGGQAASVLDRFQRLLILTAAIVLWMALNETVFLLVGAGAAWRAFSRDAASEPNASILKYFLFLLIALGLTMYAMPGHGAGAP